MITTVSVIARGKEQNWVTAITKTFLLSDDDIIFEDFARQRLIGAKDDKDEDDEGTDSPKLNDR